MRAWATAGTGFVALAIAVAGLALLTAEGRRTDRALLELGAPPRLHRHLAGIRALLLCWLAAALALVVGGLALTAVARADPSSSIGNVIGLPASGVVLVLAVVPLGTAVVAWAPRSRHLRPHLRE
jgi:hypothetical protein